MKIENGLVFRDEGHFEYGTLYIDGDRFAESALGDVLDARDLYVIPGLVDIHLHGCAGYDFSDGTQEALDRIVKYQLENGVTAICPTTMALPRTQLETVLKNVAGYEETCGAAVLGVNLEGTFLSAGKAGAQNRTYLCNPDIEVLHGLQKMAAGKIKLVSVAPELPGAMEFIEKAAKDVRMSVAHTEADYETAAEAFERGARHVTHLYNAMEPFGHRTPGVAGAAFDKNDVMVELIADGVHIHPAVVRATFQMFGAERIILISDSMRACGLSDGEYTLGGQCVTVKGAIATLADGTIAGSVMNLMDMVRCAVKMGIPLEQAVQCASGNPAKALGTFGERGSLRIGSIADAVLLDRDLNIRYIIQEGRVIKCE